MFILILKSAKTFVRVYILYHCHIMLLNYDWRDTDYLKCITVGAKITARRCSMLSYHTVHVMFSMITKRDSYFVRRITILIKVVDDSN